MKEISAGLVIYRKTLEGLKFLILYHGHNYWNFPKGKLETSEKSFQAALREVEEETGLGRNDLRFDEYFKTKEGFTFWSRFEKAKVFKIVTLYLAESKKKEIKISREHEGFGWFSYPEAFKLLRHKDSQRVIKQAHDFLKRRSYPKRKSTPPNVK